MGAKLPLIRPKIPKAIMVTVKAASPARAMPMALPWFIFQFVDPLAAYSNSGLTRKR